MAIPVPLLIVRQYLPLSSTAESAGGSTGSTNGNSYCLTGTGVTAVVSASVVTNKYKGEGNHTPSTNPTSREQPQPRGTQRAANSENAICATDSAQPLSSKIHFGCVLRLWTTKTESTVYRCRSEGQIR